MKRILFLALAFSLLVLGACRPQNAGDAPEPAAAPAARSGVDRASRARLEVQGEPTVGEATVVVYLLDDGEGVSGAQVEVTGNMTHAGMEPVIAAATESEPGLYRTENFRFTMAGDWILTAEIQFADGTTATTETAVTVSAP